MIEPLNNIADKWFNWELAILWQVAVLIAIIWVIDLLIRKWAWPQVRYALWLLILVKLVLPPTLTSPTSFTAKIHFAAQQVVKNQIAQPQPFETTEPVAAVTAVESPQYYEDALIESSLANVPARFTEAVPAVVTLSWKAYAFFVWLAGIVILASWLIIRLSNLRHEHLKGIQQANLPDGFRELLEVTARRLNLKKVPRVILTNKVCCPAIFGVFRPVLLMPANKLKNLARQDAEHILLHELAHIKRGDLFVHAIHMILQIAYWFNPLLWLTRKQLQNLRELCCDATVAKILKEKTPQYRETLLETARQLLSEPIDPGLGLLGLFENSNWLVERLKWLERKTWRNRPVRIAAIFVLVCLMATCVMPMAKFESGPAGFVVKGTVTDAKTERPITGAKVGDVGQYAEGKQWTTTDANGNYSYKTWYEEHGVKVEAPGYKTETKGLLTKFIGSEKEKVIDFALTPEEVAEQSDFKATLSNGVVVELVGVGEHPSEGNQWWHPNGRLRISPYASIGAKVYDGQPREFAVRLWYLTDEEISCRWGFIPSALYGGGHHPRDKNGKKIEDIWAVAAGIDEGIERVTVRFGVSGGKWQKQATFDGKGASSMGRGGYAFNFAKPYVENNHTYVTVSDNMLEFPHRLIAVDKDGGIHKSVDTSSGTAGEIRQSTSGFKNLPVENVQEFQFQTRVYEWAEFRNVSLRPGYRTKVEVAIDEGLLTNEEKKESPVASETIEEESVADPQFPEDNEEALIRIMIADLWKAVDSGGSAGLRSLVEPIYFQNSLKVQAAKKDISVADLLKTVAFQKKQRYGLEPGKIAQVVLFSSLESLAFTEYYGDHGQALVYYLKKTGKNWLILGLFDHNKGDGIGELLTECRFDHDRLRYPERYKAKNWLSALNGFLKIYRELHQEYPESMAELETINDNYVKDTFHIETADGKNRYIGGYPRFDPKRYPDFCFIKEKDRFPVNGSQAIVYDKRLYEKESPYKEQSDRGGNVLCSIKNGAKDFEILFVDMDTLKEHGIILTSNSKQKLLKTMIGKEEDAEKRINHWIHESALEIASKRGRSEVVSMCGIGANDVIFLPKTDPLEEILSACLAQGISPPLNRKVCNSFLKSCIGEIHTIQPGSTRADVLRVLDPDGGMSTRSAQIYHSKQCQYLKVRIAYDYPRSKDRDKDSVRGDEDIVSDVSIVYLGLVALD